MSQLREQNIHTDVYFRKRGIAKVRSSLRANVNVTPAYYASVKRKKH